MIRPKGAPKLCLCGCGLEVTKTWALYRPECYARREHERNVARGKTRIRPERGLPKRAQRAQQVRSDPDRVSEKLCKVCAGLSWHRPLGPLTCRCGEYYAPAPPIERGSLLRSSAGTARTAGSMYCGW